MERYLTLRHAVTSWPTIIDNICLVIVIWFSAALAAKKCGASGSKLLLVVFLKKKKKTAFFRWNYLNLHELWNEIKCTDAELKDLKNNFKSF